MEKINAQKKLLREYFSKQTDILMAFIFGSYAKGRALVESDVDIAVYFKPQNQQVEWEIDKKYADESQIWLEVERIVKKNVDLLVLNRAFSTVAFEVLRTGVPIIIKDRRLYLRFFSRVSFEAMDFMEMADDYWAIEERSG
ncbi:MAG: nucleotidyltransferase domain-containing protein [Candidatus Schekmanbacteria bacterium]|nr:nucleotidyltransferase domain-containing protein [Candidatus Schekmanbacteria bacterium]